MILVEGAEARPPNCSSQLMLQGQDATVRFKSLVGGRDAPVQKIRQVMASRIRINKHSLFDFVVSTCCVYLLGGSRETSGFCHRYRGLPFLRLAFVGRTQTGTQLTEHELNLPSSICDRIMRICAAIDGNRMLLYVDV